MAASTRRARSIVTCFGDVLGEADPAALARIPRPGCRNGCRRAACRCRNTRSIATSGEAHAQLFEVECRIPALGLRSPGSRRSRRAAEQAAAEAAVERAGQCEGGDARGGDLKPCARGLSLRPCRDRGPAERGQVDAHERAHRAEDQHHVEEAADDPPSHPGIVTDADAQFVFVDTPGFQTRHRSPLNDRLNRTVRESLPVSTPSCSCSMPRGSSAPIAT